MVAKRRRSGTAHERGIFTFAGGFFGAVSLCLSLAATPDHARADVILQIFESSYKNTVHRVPDIFAAGYDALWIPPPGRAQCADCSDTVGYDTFQRFDLGSPGKPTRYGTREELEQLIREAHKANIAVYIDTILNHNGFSDQDTPGFLEQGDYPGFIARLKGIDENGDFHDKGDGGEENGRLGGLIDIDQAEDLAFIRHPVDANDPRNIPGNPENTEKEPASESNRQFYPDTDPNSPPQLGNTSGDRHTPSGFNLDRPLAGDPVVENATGLLLRYCKWMVEVIGVDGFRLDAMKHVPRFFWNDFYDQAVFKIGPNGSTPYSFGEVIESFKDDKLGSFVRKDGFGNRDLLDFPLHHTMADRDVGVLNGTGDRSMRQLEGASVDRVDGDPNDGSVGVLFVQSHDEGGPPPAANNIAYAHILTRTGFPLVYFNAREFKPDADPNKFPRDGRGDALGGQFGNIVTTLVGIHDEYARDRHIRRFVDDDVYIYERDRALIVGLNDHKRFDADRTIQTSFPGGTTLAELTGNPRATNPLVIKADGTVTLKIPHDGDDRGYAMWGPKAPSESTSVEPFTITPVASVIPPDGNDVPNGLRRIMPIERVTADSVTLKLTLEDENLDDRAFVRIDDGRTNIIGTPIFGEEEFKGYQTFSNADPGVTGKGVYSAKLDVSKLDNGTHYIEAIAFLKRSSGTPPIFQTFRKVVLVDRSS